MHQRLSDAGAANSACAPGLGIRRQGPVFGFERNALRFGLLANVLKGRLATGRDTDSINFCEATPAEAGEMISLWAPAWASSGSAQRNLLVGSQMDRNSNPATTSKKL